jgi:hypothetical protein
MKSPISVPVSPLSAVECVKSYADNQMSKRRALGIRRVYASRNVMKEYLIRNFDPFRTALAMFILLLANSAALAQEDVPKFEVGARFSLLSLQRPSQIVKHPIDPGAVGVGPGAGSRTESGFGGRFTYNLTSNLAFEAEGNLFPRSEVGRGMPGGRIFQGQFGVKAGKRSLDSESLAKLDPDSLASLR